MNSVRFLWSKLWGRIAIETILILAIELIYVTARYHPASPVEFRHRLSDTLFMSSLILFIFALLYTIRFFGWRRRNYLPQFFRFGILKALFNPSEYQEHQKVSEEIAERDRELVAKGVKRDTSLLISSILLLVFSICIYSV